MQIETKFNLRDKVYGFQVDRYSKPLRDVIGPMTIDRIETISGALGTSVRYHFDLGLECPEGSVWATRAEAEAAVAALNAD
jgi:hypothetical protein